MVFFARNFLTRSPLAAAGKIKATSFRNEVDKEYVRVTLRHGEKEGKKEERAERGRGSCRRGRNEMTEEGMNRVTLSAVRTFGVIRRRRSATPTLATIYGIFLNSL